MKDEPLRGLTVVVTRQPEQGRALRDALEGLGARVLELPAIEVRPPTDGGPLDEALRRLSSFDWVVFTSANAVGAVGRRLSSLGLSGALLRTPPRVAVVGPATADAVHETFPGAAVALDAGKDARAAGLLDALRGVGIAGQRVLLPASSRARGELGQGLRAAGAEVTVVEAYETGAPPELGAQVRACLEALPDLFVFASPSAVSNLAAAAGDRLGGQAAVVIGPTTREAARDAGLEVRGMAEEPSTEGLLAAVVRYYRPSP